MLYHSAMQAKKRQVPEFEDLSDLRDNVVLHVERRKGVRHGSPCVAGTSLRVAHVVRWLETEGRSVDEVLQDFPQLTKADIYSALAFYQDNKETVDAEERERHTRVEDFLKDDPDVVRHAGRE